MSHESVKYISSGRSYKIEQEIHKIISSGKWINSKDCMDSVFFCPSSSHSSILVKKSRTTIFFFVIDDASRTEMFLAVKNPPPPHRDGNLWSRIFKSTPSFVLSFENFSYSHRWSNNFENLKANNYPIGDVVWTWDVVSEYGVSRMKIDIL